MINNARLEVLYRNVRDKLKSGKLDGFQKPHIHEIDQLVKARETRCPFADGSLQDDFFKLQSGLRALRKACGNPGVAGNPLYLKAVSISLEFRDYLEVLPTDSWLLLATLASQFLDEFGSGKFSTPADVEGLTRPGRELLKERARLVSVYANQLRRLHRYEEAGLAVKSAQEIVRLLRTTGMQCNTVVGGLLYVESKLLRHYGQYRECEERLTRAVNHYILWMMDNSENPKNIQLASYKIAMFLGNIAWCKNSRGFCTDASALINAARLLILPTEWELDKAHLDLIYADVERAFISTNSKQLLKAISIIEHSYQTFKKHPHKRMKSRAAFASALLNFYGNNIDRAEQKLAEVLQFSEEEKDRKWLVNGWTLLARIRIKQGKAQDALLLLSKSIDEATLGALTNQQIVARIVKGEAHCSLGNYHEALKSFEEARKLNEKRIGEGIEVGSERNKGWILLSMAEAYLLAEEIGQAKIYLDRWEQLDNVEFVWLKEKAERIRDKVKALWPEHFIIESGAEVLSWKRHHKGLAAWLINQAELQTGSKKNEVVANALGISLRRLGQLKGLEKKGSTPPRKVGKSRQSRPHRKGR